MRWLVVGAVLVLAAPIDSAGRAVADGLPDELFGAGGVVVDSTVLNGGVAARVTDVIDDHHGRLLVAGTYWSAVRVSVPGGVELIPPFYTFVARYNRLGKLDSSFGVGGVVRKDAFLQTALSPKLAVFSDGSVLVTSWPQDLSGSVPPPPPSSPPPPISPPSSPPGPYLHLSDSGQALPPVRVGSSLGAPVELPDGRVAVSVAPFWYPGRAPLIRMLRPDAAIDLSFDGTVGSDVVPASPEVGPVGIIVGSDGSLLSAVAVSAGLCRVVKFRPAGGMDSSFGAVGVISVPTFAGRCELVRDADGEGLLQTNMPSQYLTVTSRIGRTGALTPVPWPFVGPAVVEGWGRTIGVVAMNPTKVGAAFGDGTLDSEFGDGGVVAFPGDFNGLRVLDHGGVIVYGVNNSANAIVLQKLDTPVGSAPEPPVLPTAKFVPLPPERVLDTRLGLGAPMGKVAAGGAIDLSVAGTSGVPTTGVVAVALNVTATESSGPGFVTVYPVGRARPVVSSLNLERADQTVANHVTVRVGAQGRVSLFTLSAAHLVADVAGYYVETDLATDGRLVSVPPERRLDTRVGVGAAAQIVPAGGTIRLQLRGVAPVPPSGVRAVVLNLTGTEATAPGFITVWPSGTPQPVVSSLNLDVGDTRANLVVVPLGADGAVSLYSSGGTHLVADIAGWFTDDAAEWDSAGLFVPLASPVRMLDTRLLQSSPLVAGAPLRLLVGSTTTVPTFGYADAAFANVTMTESSGPGFLTLWPAGSAQPFVSNLNASRTGQTVPNASIVKLGDDVISGYLSAGAHVIIDVSGWYTAY